MVTYGVIVPSCPPVTRISGGRLSSMMLAGALWLAAGMNGTCAADQESLRRDAFLRAIAEVETGGNSRAVGRRGERGMFQFRRATWRQYTNRAFYDAHDPSAAFEVAVKHYDWLYAGLVRNGRDPTPYLLASAWNAGLTRTLGGIVPPSTQDYASRVTNLASAFGPKAPPESAPAFALAFGR